jgi:hypothetical protein
LLHHSRQIYRAIGANLIARANCFSGGGPAACPIAKDGGNDDAPDGLTVTKNTQLVALG